MILYLSAYAVFIVFFFAGTIPGVRQYEKLILFISCSIIWVLVVFSQNVGPDYESYRFMYERLNENFFKQELFFRLFGYAFRAYDLSYEWFYFSISTLYLSFIFYSFYKYRNFTAINFLMFIVMPYGLIEGGFNYIRQNVALGLFYFSLVALCNKGWVRYFAFNIIGALFHKSAFLLLPLYFVLRVRWKARVCLILFFITLSFTLLLALPFVKNILTTLIGMLPFYGSTYAEFRDGEFFEGLSGKGIASYVYQMIPLLLLTYYKDRVVRNQIENILFNITFLSLITLTLAVELRILLRLEYYFVFAKVFTIPLLLRLCKDARSRTLWFLVIIGWSSLYLGALYLTAAEKNLSPYQSVLGFEVN